MSEAAVKYDARAAAVNSLLCVGLDSDLGKLPARFHEEANPQLAFNRWIIAQTHPYASAFKLNAAFYEAQGAAGLEALAGTVDHLRAEHPDVLTICDAKRGDIGSTNLGYVAAIFDRWGFDAVTLNPYLGREALEPFLARADKVSILLCRTSNPGAGELQDLDCGGMPLWAVVAERISQHWNARGNCMLVAGATYPDELRQIRAIAGEMTLLVPGIGVQGGDVAQTVRAGLNSVGRGMIVNSSRGIIFADDPADEAAALRDAINAHRPQPASA